MNNENYWIYGDHFYYSIDQVSSYILDNNFGCPKFKIFNKNFISTR